MTDLRVATDDLFMRVHAEGTITGPVRSQYREQSRARRPDAQPSERPLWFFGTYASAPGLSLDLHRDDVAETADTSIRHDVLTILRELTAEVWDNRHRVGSG